MEREIILKGTDGVSISVIADVLQFSPLERTLRCGALILASFVFGAGSIFVPLWHFIGTWAFPLMGVLVGRMLYQVRGKIGTVRGVCAACNNEMSLCKVGAIDNEPLWIRCPSCAQPWEVKV